MRKNSLAIAALALTAGLFLTLAHAAESNSSGVMIGATAPAFSLPNQDGKTVSLADFKGKIVVLEWTNRDCPYVQRHLKAKTMISLAQKWKEKGVTWLAIDSTYTHDVSIDKKMAAEFGIAYPILSDQKGVVAHLYGAKSTPDMFIINQEGKLIYSGAIDNDLEGEKPDRLNYVDQALTQLTAGQNITTPETKSYGCAMKYAP